VLIPVVGLSLFIFPIIFAKGQSDGSFKSAFQPKPEEEMQTTEANLMPEKGKKMNQIMIDKTNQDGTPNQTHDDAGVQKQLELPKINN